MEGPYNGGDEEKADSHERRPPPTRRDPHDLIQLLGGGEPLDGCLSEYVLLHADYLADRDVMKDLILGEENDDAVLVFLARGYLPEVIDGDDSSASTRDSTSNAWRSEARRPLSNRSREIAIA